MSLLYILRHCASKQNLLRVLAPIMHCRDFALAVPEPMLLASTFDSLHCAGAQKGPIGLLCAGQGHKHCNSTVAHEHKFRHMFTE